MPNRNVYRNLPVHTLIRKSLNRRESILSGTGALVVNTGKYTGRSPKDKYIVDTPDIRKKIDWNVNTPLPMSRYTAIRKKIQTYLDGLDDVYIFDGFVGADQDYRIHTRVISEFAYHSLFSTQLLRRPSAGELKKHSPALTVICAPGCVADPRKDGTRSEAFIILNIKKMTVLIGGTRYAGEIKKAIFTVMNILLPDKGVLPMHCSANSGKGGDTALFFGLSGTGKTTLSADPERFLIGDDEHGWSNNGVFNFEGGCYAKCIRLKKEHEPLIWNAIRHGSVVENVAVTKDGSLDFESDMYTENTRAVYPLEHIENAVLSGTGSHPSHIIFLACDALGVLPPVSRLTSDQAKEYFYLGYTAKIAGTERGIKEPKLTFSRFFGGPFMPLLPHLYTDLFARYTSRYRSKVYLVNTGWTGGAYGTGQRISIDKTRVIISAILRNQLDRAKFIKEPFFGLHVPNHVPGISSDILNPRAAWKNKKLYDAQARLLSEKFRTVIGESGFSDHA